MKLLASAIFVVSIIACLDIFQSRLYAEEIEIPKGTPVKLEIVQTITSEEAAIGQAVHLVVARDVEIEGKTVIRGGAPAEGTVTEVKKRGTLGEAGKVTICVKSTRAVDGTQVPVGNSLSVQGKAGGMYPVETTRGHLFLFREGEAAQIAGGVEFIGYVDSPVKVRVER